MITKKRKRLDVMLAEKGFFKSREAARRAIMAGEVYVHGELATKPGRSFEPGSEITIRERRRYVGRGGDKLEHAISFFKVETAGKVAVDIGSSTGGFTDCLLSHGAGRVYAVDVGRGLIDFSLRHNGRVRLMEGINARYLKRDSLPERPQLATVDVSFISLEKILPAVRDILDETGEVIALIKPQFEAGRERVSRGGVVRDPAVRKSVVERIKRFAREHGFTVAGVVESPLKGPAGNIEYFIHLRPAG